MQYNQHPGQPIFYPVPVLPSPVMLQDHPYQPFRVPAPNHEHENSVGGNEGNRPMPPHPRGDPHGWRPPAGTYGARPHPGGEGHAHFSQAWQNPQMFGRENTNLPQGVGPRAFVRPMVPPPLGYINGPPYPGTALYIGYYILGILKLFCALAFNNSFKLRAYASHVLLHARCTYGANERSTTLHPKPTST